MIEKGSEVGAHILSGAVMDPRALTELFPDWKEQGRAAERAGDRGPLPVPHARRGSFKVPELHAARLLQEPRQLRHQPGQRVPLARASRPRRSGVEIFPGFAAAEVLYDDDGTVQGVATGDMGIGKNGEKTDALPARHGAARASTRSSPKAAAATSASSCEAHFKLREGADPQVYGIGLKELWEVKPEKHQPGLVVHTAGWPLDSDTYGGSFLYHLENNQVAVGFVVGPRLHAIPYLIPYEEFQRYKTHPGDPRLLRRRQARRLRRARDRRGRPAVAAEARLPRRRADRRRRGLPQRLAHQGQPRRDQVRHARRRGGVRGARAPAARGDELAAYPDAFRAELAARRAAPRAQLQAVDVEGPVHRHADGRHRPGRVPRQGAVDAAPRPCRPRDAEAQDRVPADRVSEARRRAHLRPAVLGVRLEHQPRAKTSRRT